MKTTVLTRALSLVIVGATMAGAQVTTVSGRVTTEAGVGIRDVYVGVLGRVIGRNPDGTTNVERAETRTAANGTYSLKIPFVARSTSGYHELGVRAVGYEPQTHTVLDGATLVEENFRLKADTYRGDTVRVVRVHGKVTTEGGVGIDGAEVYLAEHRISVTTNAVGEYRFEAPAANGLRSVRVRAVGYVPDVEPIVLAPGSQRNVEINFALKRDPNGAQFETSVATKVPGARTKTTTGTATKNPGVVQATEPARVPYAVAAGSSLARRDSLYRRLSEARAQGETTIQADPFNRYLFQPDQVMRYQDALGLTEDQRGKLQTAMEESQKRAVQVQWALALENEKLQKTLDKPTLDETEVVAQMDRIVGVEREMKRAQLQMLIKIKNTLTAEQQERLRQLRGYDN
jgi:regulator of replication initiation timing